MNNVSSVAWSVCVSVSAAKTDEFLRCHLWCGLVGPKEPLGGGPDPPQRDGAPLGWRTEIIVGHQP